MDTCWFHILAAANHAAMNISILFLLGTYLVVELWITWSFYINFLKTPKAQSTKTKNGTASNKKDSAGVSQRHSTPKFPE